MYTHSCYVGEYHFLNFFFYYVSFLCHLLPVCYCTTLKGNLSARGFDPLCECSEFDMPCCTYHRDDTQTYHFPFIMEKNALLMRQSGTFCEVPRALLASVRFIIARFVRESCRSCSTDFLCSDSHTFP